MLSCKSVDLSHNLFRGYNLAYAERENHRFYIDTNIFAVLEKMNKMKLRGQSKDQLDALKLFKKFLTKQKLSLPIEISIVLFHEYCGKKLEDSSQFNQSKEKFRDVLSFFTKDVNFAEELKTFATYEKFVGQIESDKINIYTLLEKFEKFKPVIDFEHTENGLFKSHKLPRAIAEQELSRFVSDNSVSLSYISISAILFVLKIRLEEKIIKSKKNNYFGRDIQEKNYFQVARLLSHSPTGKVKGLADVIHFVECNNRTQQFTNVTNSTYGFLSFEIKIQKTLNEFSNTWTTFTMRSGEEIDRDSLGQFMESIRNSPNDAKNDLIENFQKFILAETRWLYLRSRFFEIVSIFFTKIRACFKTK